MEKPATLNQLVTIPWWLYLVFMIEGGLLYVWMWEILPWFTAISSILGGGIAVILVIKYQPVMKARLVSKPRRIRVRTHPAWIVLCMRYMLVLMTLVLIARLLYTLL